MAEVEHWDRVVELARISLENPAVMAVLRLHHNEYGSCAECTGEYSQTWPCRTVLAIEVAAARPKPIVIDPAEAVGFMANIHAQVAGLETGEIIRPKEPTDGTA